MLTNYDETPWRGSKYIAHGNTLGNTWSQYFALKGQKICYVLEYDNAFALTGCEYRGCTYTQGVAMGYVLAAPFSALKFSMLITSETKIKAIIYYFTL